MRSIQSIRSSRRRRRSIGALLLALFALGQVLGGLHLAVETHDHCPVDGQLAHGDHGHGAGHELDHDEDAAPRLTAPGEAEELHGEHCAHAFLGQLHEPPTGSPSEAAPDTRGPGAPILERAVPRAPRIPLFRLAPKQSPPGAA